MSFRTAHVSTAARSQAAAPDGPPRCPACGCTSTVSKDKVPNVNSYWRCNHCQEVWSPERQIARVGWAR